MDTSDLPRKNACFIADPIEDTVRGGRASRLAAAAACEALEDAGFGVTLPQDARGMTVIGTTMGETEFIEDRLSGSEEEWLNDQHAREIANGWPGSISRAVSQACGARAGSTDVYGACAAGNMAIALACRSLLTGRCDVVLAGGSDAFSRLAFIGFMRLRLTAADRCRPFDKERDGLFVGEGSAVFVLERASSAAARGVRVRARVAGAAMTSESHHPTRPHPEGDGLTRAILGAMESAGMTPGDIDYVNAHGTGTPQNDMIEAKVMDKVLRAGTPFSSTKALTGHTMGAAGAMEAAVCVLTIEHQRIVPTWHLEDPLEPCVMDAVRGGVRDATVRAALNNSAGFGGYNSCVVLTAA
jgi:3-oxoacyl-[acyl-carrier-protein] synthase II